MYAYWWNTQIKDQDNSKKYNFTSEKLDIVEIESLPEFSNVRFVLYLEIS